MNALPLGKCRDCGGVVSGYVRPGEHAVISINGKRRNCIGNEVIPEGGDPWSGTGATRT